MLLFGSLSNGNTFFGHLVPGKSCMHRKNIINLAACMIFAKQAVY